MNIRETHAIIAFHEKLIAISVHLDEISNIEDKVCNGWFESTIRPPYAML